MEYEFRQRRNVPVVNVYALYNHELPSMSSPFGVLLVMGGLLEHQSLQIGHVIVLEDFHSTL